MHTSAHQEISQRLFEQLDEARRQYLAASERFDAVTGKDRPDGSVLMEKAGKELRRSRDLFASALKRYSEYILDNVIPEDMRL